MPVSKVHIHTCRVAAVYMHAAFTVMYPGYGFTASFLFARARHAKLIIQPWVHHQASASLPRRGERISATPETAAESPCDEASYPVIAAEAAAGKAAIENAIRRSQRYPGRAEAGGGPPSRLKLPAQLRPRGHRQSS